MDPQRCDFINVLGDREFVEMTLALPERRAVTRRGELVDRYIERRNAYLLQQVAAGKATPVSAQRPSVSIVYDDAWERLEEERSASVMK